MVGKAFPSLQPRTPKQAWRVFRYPFKRGTPPQRPLLIVAAAVAGTALFGLRLADTGTLTMPLPVTVRYVIDGETLKIEPVTLPNGKVYSRVRFHDFSAPEIGTRAKCAREAELGLQAKSKMATMFNPGQSVNLIDARPGRYPGRLIAKVLTPDGRDPGVSLIREKLAVPFEPYSRPWCAQ